MTFEAQRVVHGFLIRVACDERLAAQANALLETIQRTVRLANVRDGARIRFGGIVLTLRAGAGGYDVHEPDFAVDPHTTTRARVDTTLSVVAAQAALAQRLGVQPADVNQDQAVVIAREALRAFALQAVRSEPQDDHDSGWSLDDFRNPADPNDADAYTTTTVLNVLWKRVALAPVLTLPPGYSALVEGTDITAVFDAAGNQRLGHTA